MSQLAKKFTKNEKPKNPTNLDILSNSNGTLDKQRFFTEIKPSDVICVQLTSSLTNGFLAPSIQLVTITNSIDFCIEHKSSPLACYGAHATRPVKNASDKYKNMREYLGIWLPLLHMETTQNSITNCEENFVIRNCKVDWSLKQACHPVTEHFETFMYGELVMNENVVNMMEFIDTAENNMAEQSGNKCGHPTFVLAYACVQYKGKN